MRSSFNLLVLLVALATAGCTSLDTASVIQDADFAIRGRLIDGTGSAPIENGVVILKDERVVCSGRVQDCPHSEEVQRVEIEGGTILPGLVDLHVHARPHYLGWFLASGVTTIRDASNSLANVAANLDTNPRPRIVWTGPMLDGPATIMRFFGEEGVMRPASEEIGTAWTLEVTTPNEAREAVDLLAERGASFIKLYEQLSPEVFAAATEYAQERGLRVMTDLGMHNTRGLAGAEVDALQAIAAGVTSIEHASGFALAYQRLGADPEQLPYDAQLIEQLASALVEHDVALVPTLSVQYSHADDVTDIDELPMADVIPDDMHAFFEQGAARRTEAGRHKSLLAHRLSEALIKRVHALGGLIGAGSDAPAGVYNLPGGGIHRELALLVEAGLTPLQAIHAATGAAGRIIGDSSVGVLTEGNIADILIVKGNPAEDIRHTRNIHIVIQRGEVVDLDALRSREE